MSPQQPNSSGADISFTDRHTVETPEQVQLHFALAGIGSRFLALALDTLLQVGAGLLVGIVLLFAGISGFLRGFQTTSLWLTAALIAFAFLLEFGYFALFETFWSGQTPGKRAIGIRVIKDTGRPLSPAETVARNLLRIVDQLPAFYGIGVLVAMCNSQGKRLGDFVAGSIVVRENSLNQVQHSWTTTPASGSSFLAGNRLTADEVALVNTFLARRYDLAPEVRDRMAQQVLLRLEPKLTLNDDDRARVETTLEAIAHEQRSHGHY